MICNPSYDSFDSIPEALRDEFEQVDGKWSLKPDAIPGVGAHFNKALADNEKKAVGQVKTRNERIKALEAEVAAVEEQRDAAKDELITYKQPGAKVLSKEDAENFDSYIKLGTPKDIEAKITKATQLESEVTGLKTSQTFTEIATKAKLNPEVLTDWVGSAEIDGVDFYMKSITAKDPKTGKDETQEVPYVRYDADEGGKKITREKELLEFAKEKMPAWKYQALTNATPAAEPQKKQNGGVQMPNLGSAASAAAAPTDSTARPVDRYNAERAAKASPFAPRTPAK